MNTISITGNVGRDPESRYTPSGVLVANFSLADQTFVNGEKGTQWFRCAVFGNRAEAVMKYVIKGTKLSVSGELTQRTYTDRDGNERLSIEVRVDRFDFAGTRQDGQQQGDNGYQQQSPRQQQAPRPQPQRQAQPAQQRQPVAAGQRQAQRQPVPAPDFFSDDFGDDFGNGDADNNSLVPF